MSTLRLTLVGISLALTCPACAQTPIEGADYVSVAAQPMNVGDAAAGAVAYRKSGAYEAG